MPLTARQKIALAIAFLVLFGLGGVFWKFFRPQLKDYDLTRAEVDGLARKFESLKKSYNNYDNPVQYLDALEPERAKWEGVYKGREKVFTTILRKIPAGEKTPEFYFHEQWKETRDRLLEKARQRNVAIPPELGFSSAIPPRDQVELLLNQLSAAEYILNMALDHGVLSITSFSRGQPIDRSGFVRLLPFQIGFVASLENAKEFLYWCGYGPQYIKVEHASLSAIREGLISRNFQVSLTLTTTWILDRAAEEAAEEEGAPGAGGTLEERIARLRGRSGRESDTAPTSRRR